MRKQVEVTAEEPGASVRVAGILQVFEEQDLFIIVLRAIDPGDPPRMRARSCRDEGRDVVLTNYGLEIAISLRFQARRMPPRVPEAGRNK